MMYKSTRDPDIRLSAAQAIVQGISPEGGLFVPESMPNVSTQLSVWAELDYKSLAKEVFALFLSDFSAEEISDCVERAYTTEKFDDDEPVKLVPLTEQGRNRYLLELWHGPTCAFKDMALQILPQFLTKSLKKAAPGKKAVILTATSGDTGKAALEGFKDVPDTSVIVFYPQNGVSPMQKRQMVTQDGSNVTVCAIDGNFDDAQAAVKRIFTDDTLKAEMGSGDMLLSSANSINWGRLLPQIVYYFYSYFQLYRNGAIKSLDDKINIAVPTGNFGNILAAYYASCMGLPVNRFICASNTNCVLTDFILTGTYDRRREFFATNSPSMDILVSSNLERLLFALSDESCEAVAKYMRELSDTGVYSLDEKTIESLQKSFFGGTCNDVETLQTIKKVFTEEGYLCDTHTAVAVNVYDQYVQQTGDTATPTVIASTASPYKFTSSVLSAVDSCKCADEFAAIAALERISKTKAPAQLFSLKDKPVRFSEVISKEQTEDFVRRSVRIGGV